MWYSLDYMQLTHFIANVPSSSKTPPFPRKISLPYVAKLKNPILKV